MSSKSGDEPLATKAEERKQGEGRSAKKDIDLQQFAVDYRAGVLNNKELAKKYGIAPSMVTYYKDRLGLVRDVTQRARVKAQRKLAVTAAEDVRAIGGEAGSGDNSNSKNSTDNSNSNSEAGISNNSTVSDQRAAAKRTKADADDDETNAAADQAADAMVAIVRDHRKHLGKARLIGMSLLQVVDDSLRGIDAIVENRFAEMQHAYEDQQRRLQETGKLNRGERMLRKPDRDALTALLKLEVSEQAAGIYQKASQPISRFIELERVTYGLDDAAPPSSLQDLLASFSGRPSSDPIARLRGEARE